MEDRINYHIGRAKAELDLAERAASVSAARSHYGLSSLHMARLRGLGCEIDTADHLTGA